MVKWLVEKRLPAWYTRSKSFFRTRRASRGNAKPTAGSLPLIGREAMTPFLAARRKHFAAARGLHPRAKPVSFGAAPSPRLKSTLWQSNPPSIDATTVVPTFQRLAVYRACIDAVAPRILRSRQTKPRYRVYGSAWKPLVYFPLRRRVKKATGILTERGK